MRSFVYLPLISTIVSLAFAVKTPEENTPVSAAENTSEEIVVPAPASGQNSPSHHSGHSVTTINAQPPFAIYPSEIQLPPGSPGSKSKYGYLCQGSLYRLQHLEKTAQHACKYMMNKKQTYGRIKYPMKLKDDNQSNTQYIFPVLPEKKMFTGGYLNFGLRSRHFLAIDPACEWAKVTIQVWENPRKSTKNWCSWPKCFSKGNLRYKDCPALYVMTDSSRPEYFRIPSN